MKRTLPLAILFITGMWMIFSFYIKGEVGFFKYLDQGAEWLKGKGVRTVELGVQSMDDEVLRINRRGYRGEMVIRAVEILRRGGLQIGIQLMVGLAGEGEGSLLRTTEEVIRLRPHFVRIYPTLVIRGTVLERWFREGRYRPLGLQEAIELSKAMVKALEGAGIPVIRIGLQPTPSLKEAVVAGPFHPAFGQLVRSRILLQEAEALLHAHRGGRVASFRVAKRDLADFYGQRGENIRRLRERFSLHEVRIIPDPSLPRGEVRWA